MDGDPGRDDPGRDLDGAANLSAPGEVAHMGQPETWPFGGAVSGVTLILLKNSH